MFLVFLELALLFVAMKSARSRDAIFFFSFAWFVCAFPIVIGLVRYHYFSGDEARYFFQLSFFLASFLIGAFAAKYLIPALADGDRLSRPSNASVDLARVRPWARVALIISTFGIFCLCIDFVINGPDLSNIAEARAIYNDRSASLLAKLASVATWGCLYCFTFALWFRSRLAKVEFYLYLLPIVGFFLVSLFSAGRQAVFQILIFSLIFRPDKYFQLSDLSLIRTKQPKLIVVSIVIASAFYMAYIAVSRNDGAISVDKSLVLQALFRFDLADWFTAIQSAVPSSVYQFLVEALVYFSSPIASFSLFLKNDFPYETFGAMSLPFLFRQIEFITDISVVNAMATLAQLMSSSGVIGVGWVTGITSYVIDFGFFGAGVLLLAQGFFTQRACDTYKRLGGFHRKLVSVTLLVAAVYMPLVAPSSDNNLLFLLVFALIGLKVESRARSIVVRRL